MSLTTSRDAADDPLAAPPADLLQRLADDVRAAGGELIEDPALAGSIGVTMFDLPGDEDNTLTVLVPRANIQAVPSQTLVRIKSRPNGDGRTYLGVVSAGPFAEPDSLRADSHLLVTVATRGGIYLPPFHGRVQVTILGEELANGTLIPPRLRPLPSSPVFALTDEESAAVLRAEGDMRLGLVVGQQNVRVGIPSDKKHVLPRHLAVLGTTGAGKSTTVAGLVKQAQTAGMAIILLDVEGEYTRLHEPTDDAGMLAALAERQLPLGGVPADRMTLFRLVGRDSTNPTHPNLRSFSLQFARLSPYVAMEMLGLNDAQTDRFLFAYDLAKIVLREVGIFPEKDATPEDLEKQERMVLRLDEFDRGWPRLTLSLFLDIVGFCKAAVTKAAFTPYNTVLRTPEAQALFKQQLNPKEMPGIASSWGKLQSVLWRLHRLKVFDRHRVGGRFINYEELLQPGQVSVFDLSDAGMTELSNLAIADVLRGIQEAQDGAYRRHEKTKNATPPAPAPAHVLCIIEEAHEFLSADRIDKMNVLFQQVARIAKRGRKRWLGLAFVTQLPQHLPRQVLGLVNSFVLHKITDPQVVSALQRTISGIDEALWNRLLGLAPGQAIASFPHLARPLLVAVDPTPAKLLLVE